jgi:hypothetical protein
MKRNLPPLDITNMPELVRFVEEMKTPKQERALIKDGEVVAIVSKTDFSVARKRLEKLCLGREIYTEAPPKTTWQFSEWNDPYALVPVTLSYQGRSLVSEFYLSGSSGIPTPAAVLEGSFDDIYEVEQSAESEGLPGGKKYVDYWKAFDVELRRVLGADYELFKQAGKPYRHY